MLPETADPIWLICKVLPRIDGSARREQEDPRHCTLEGSPG
jgi:hypothetical protein